LAFSPFSPDTDSEETPTTGYGQTLEEVGVQDDAALDSMGLLATCAMNELNTAPLPLRESKELKESKESKKHKKRKHSASSSQQQITMNDDDDDDDNDAARDTSDSEEENDKNDLQENTAEEKTNSEKGKSKWSLIEDQRLIDAVKLHGAKKWYVFFRRFL
jgi:hypothetical protein